MALRHFSRPSPPPRSPGYARLGTELLFTVTNSGTTGRTAGARSWSRGMRKQTQRTAQNFLLGVAKDKDIRKITRAEKKSVFI